MRRFGGFVAKYMGDGVLVYFGYPQAHEDDAERAVRAGLELIDAVSALEAKCSTANARRHRHRAGRRGRSDRRGSAQEQAVVGETPNLAARLQALAEPNTVVIAASTRQAARRSVRAGGPRAATDSTASPSRNAPGAALARAAG